jgi:hypothetical protein
MRNVTLAAIIGGVFASAAASAANFDLFIGGSSGQMAFYKANFGTTVCGVNPVSTYTITGASISNEAWRCAAGVTTITGISAGDVVTIHYNSELDTISAVAPLYYNNAIAPRLFVNPDSPDCVGTICTVASYSNQTETFSSVNGTALMPMNSFAGRAVGPFTQFDIGVLDVEIKFWSLPNNWTDGTFNAAMGTIPSAAGLVAIPGAIITNGHVFSVIVNSFGPAALVGNLSLQTISSIVAGKYNDWGDAPEIGGGNTTPITLCRMESGSGTQVAASIYFTGFDCARSSTAYASSAAPGALTNVVENTSTAAVRSCVQGDVGSIGVASLNTAWETLDINGIQANAHNAAAEYYRFAYETVVYNRATTSGASVAVQGLASTLINNARRASKLTSQVEATAVVNGSGNWTVPSNRRAVYALPMGGIGNTPPTLTKLTGDINTPGVIEQTSIALNFYNADACKKPW